MTVYSNYFYTGLVTSFAGLATVRAFLGLVEGPMFPGIVLYLSGFYTREELSLRYVPPPPFNPIPFHTNTDMMLIVKYYYTTIGSVAFFFSTASVRLPHSPPHSYDCLLII